MPSKKTILPRRIRQAPKQFSGVDGHLVLKHKLNHCNQPVAALYLCLVSVVDALSQVMEVGP